MRRAMLGVVIMACGMVACSSPTEPTVAVFSLNPASAVLSEGQSQTFTIVGGTGPFLIQVHGCMFDTTSCATYNIEDYRYGYPGVVRLERVTEREIRVTYVNAYLEPRYSYLEVVDGTGEWVEAKLYLLYQPKY